MALTANQGRGIAAIGAVAGSIGLAYVWKSHRIWGFILGGLFIGAPIGAAVASILGAPSWLPSLPDTAGTSTLPPAAWTT